MKNLEKNYTIHKFKKVFMTKEGYLPKDPKRILPGDDQSLALMITTNTILPNRKAQFMKDIFEQNVMDDIIGEARKEFEIARNE